MDAAHEPSPQLQAAHWDRETRARAFLCTAEQLLRGDVSISPETLFHPLNLAPYQPHLNSGLLRERVVALFDQCAAPAGGFCPHTCSLNNPYCIHAFTHARQLTGHLVAPHACQLDTAPLPLVLVCPGSALQRVADTWPYAARYGNTIVNSHTRIGMDGTLTVAMCALVRV
jgi:hypothetical protein